ncbi:MAG: hypothetical protein D6761_08420 [Candidatus Dadabacteria bacterium]|nr:MAG: hypothetical protein D6761_08420 [Candidatus Dadabacteria bacterium]
MNPAAGRLIQAVILAIAVVAIPWASFAEQGDFEKSIKPTAKLYTGYSVQVAEKTGGTRNTANPNGFEVTRFYMGFKAHLSPHVKSSVVLDMGRVGPLVDVAPDGSGGLELHSDKRFFAYMKKGYFQFVDIPGNLTVTIGQGGMPWVGFVEKAWGHRYVEKVATDAHKLQTSTGLGVSLSGDPVDGLQFHASLMNGPGYKKPEDNESKLLELRTTAQLQELLDSSLKKLEFSVLGAMEPSVNGIETWQVGGLAFIKADAASAGVEVAHGKQRTSTGARVTTLSAFSTLTPFDDPYKIVVRADAFMPKAGSDVDLEAIAGAGYVFEKVVDTLVNVQFKRDDSSDKNTWVLAWDWQVKF